MQQTCPKCQSAVAASATACPKCGSSLPAPEHSASSDRQSAVPLTIVIVGAATSLYGVIACLMFLFLAFAASKSALQMWKADVVLPSLLSLLAAILFASGVGLLVRKRWSLQVIQTGALATVILAGAGLVKSIGRIAPAGDPNWVPLSVIAAIWMIVTVVVLKLPTVSRFLEAPQNVSIDRSPGGQGATQAESFNKGISNPRTQHSD